MPKKRYDTIRVFVRFLVPTLDAAKDLTAIVAPAFPEIRLIPIVLPSIPRVHQQIIASPEFDDYIESNYPTESSPREIIQQAYQTKPDIEYGGFYTTGKVAIENGVKYCPFYVTPSLHLFCPIHATYVAAHEVGHALSHHLYGSLSELYSDGFAALFLAEFGFKGNGRQPMFNAFDYVDKSKRSLILSGRKRRFDYPYPIIKKPLQAAYGNLSPIEGPQDARSLMAIVHNVVTSAEVQAELQRWNHGIENAKVHQQQGFSFRTSLGYVWGSAWPQHIDSDVLPGLLLSPVQRGKAVSRATRHKRFRVTLEDQAISTHFGMLSELMNCEQFKFEGVDDLFISACLFGFVCHLRTNLNYIQDESRKRWLIQAAGLCYELFSNRQSEKYKELNITPEQFIKHTVDGAALQSFFVNLLDTSNSCISAQQEVNHQHMAFYAQERYLKSATTFCRRMNRLVGFQSSCKKRHLTKWLKVFGDPTDQCKIKLGLYQLRTEVSRTATFAEEMAAQPQR